MININEVTVTADENEKGVQLLTEKDGCLKVATVLSAFPESSGLAYKCTKTGGWKSVEKKNEFFLQPDTGWNSQKLIAITGKKIKFKLSNLSPNVREKSLRDYFNRFGISELVNINKTDGVGYITVRFIKDTHLDNLNQQKNFTLEKVDQADSMKFFKRSGTTNQGNKYEELTIAYLLLYLALDENVKDFGLSSNDDDFGSFDDIVVDVKLINGDIRKYAFQLKYSNDKGQLHKTFLTKVKGNFSIQKYFQDFLDMIEYTRSYNLILLTNLKFNLDGQILNLENSNIQLKIVREELPKELGSGSCFKFHVVHAKSEQQKKFFEIFYLYPNQPNVHKMEENILRNFHEQFSCSSIHYYLKFISEWCNKLGHKKKLNKEIVKTVITLQVLTPLIKSFSFAEKEENENTQLIKEAILNFDVTLVDEIHLEMVKKIWENENDDVGTIEKTIGEHHISNILDYDKKRTIALWILNKCPLIVEEGDATYSVLTFCREKKFILLKNASIPPILHNLKIFTKLSDLDSNSVLYKNIIKTFRCSIQGKQTINLEELIEQNELFREIVTTNELVQMLDNSFVIGKPEAILDIYIERAVTRLVIDNEFFEKIDRDTLVIISCQGNILKDRFKKFNLIDVEDCINENQSENFLHCKLKEGNFEKRIYVSKNYCERDVFNAVCNKNANKTKCHHFSLAEDGSLEWIYSKGEINDLQVYKSTSCFMKEEDLVNCKPDTKINIITADPGMGKTEMMRKFTNNDLPSFWTVLILAQNWFEYLKGDDICIENFIERAINNACKTYFEKKMFKIMLISKRITFLWDGLDELSSKELDNAVKIINSISEYDCRQWITCRRHLENSLEKTFNVLARKIAPFDEVQQKNYIERRLGDDSDAVAEKIQHYISTVQYNEILGIPLQIFMLTELFLRQPEKCRILLDEVFSIADLYQHFLDMKFEIFFKEKVKLDVPNFALQNILTMFQKDQLRYHQKAALLMTLEAELVEEFDVESDLAVADNTAKGIGIIVGENEENKPKFLHTSYAEYLVALYFYDHRIRHSVIIKQIIFQENYINIRFMFDLLLAKNSFAHLAVICNNFQCLLVSQNYTCKDEGGRNLLQIACSWGPRFPLLTTEQGDVLLIDDDKADSLNVSNILDYEALLRLLLQHNNVTEDDTLFGMTSIQYADMSLSFKALIVFLKQEHTFSFDSLNNFDTNTIVYYSLRFDYKEALTNMQHIPFFKLRKDYNTALHMASTYNSINSLRILLSLPDHKSEINARNSYGAPPIFLASSHNHHEVVNLLAKSGADVNIPTEDGLLPIHAAAVRGHVELVDLLIKLNSELNVQTAEGYNLVYLAALEGHCDVVQRLLTAGADANLPRRDGGLPIHAAAVKGHTEIVKLLTRHTADLNARSDKGITPVWAAASEGHFDVVQCLLEVGADVNVAEETGSLPVHIAAQKGHTDIVRALIGQNINARNSKGITPVYAAALGGHLDTVECLVESGADVNISGRDGSIAIHAAAAEGHNDVVKLLMSHSDVNAKSGDGYTPVYFAASKGHDDVIKSLVEAGADVNLPARDGSIPINVASARGFTETVKLLIRLNSELNVNTDEGYILLYNAALLGHYEVVECLLASGALNLPRKDGGFPIHAAAVNGHVEIVKLLIRHNVDLNARSDKGITPVWAAASGGHFDVVKCLVNAGADVNISEQNGALPLHIAAQKGRGEIVEFLIRQNCDVNARNDKGITAVYAAALGGHSDVVECLVAAGADVNVPGRDGSTPILAAAINGHTEIVEFLIRLEQSNET